MKKRLTLLLTAALTLTACTPTIPEVPETQLQPTLQSEQTSEPYTSATVTSAQFATSAPPVITPPVRTAPPGERSANITEINLSRLIANAHPNSNVWDTKALDERHFVIHSGHYSDNTVLGIMLHLYDTKTMKLVYSTEMFEGSWHGEFISNEKGDFVFYKKKRMSDHVTVTDHALVHLTAAGYTVEQIDEEPPQRVVAGKQLFHENGSIYDDVNGELVELVPATVNPFSDNEQLNREYNQLALYFDKHRFVYVVYGYEWIAGIGVYDFRTGTNTRLPDTDSMWPFASDSKYIYVTRGCVIGGTDYPGIYAIDIDTFEVVFLLDTNKLGEENNVETYCRASSQAISPDKTKLVVAVTNYDYYNSSQDGGELRFLNPYTFITYSLPDLTVAATYHLEPTHTPNGIVEFMGNNRVLVHGGGVYQKDRLAFLIDLE